MKMMIMDGYRGCGGDALMYQGFDENYEPNDYGWLCEGIIDKIPGCKGE